MMRIRLFYVLKLYFRIKKIYFIRSKDWQGEKFFAYLPSASISLDVESFLLLDDEWFAVEKK